MATTDEIIRTARDLGKRISTHEAAKKFEQTLRALEKDQDAQRALNDYHRHVQSIAEKEANGKPIEVADKRRLQELQGQMATNAILREFQMAQMDYLDLMRKIDDAMTESAPTVSAPPTPGPQSPGEQQTPGAG